MSYVLIRNTLESGEVLRYHAAPGVPKQTDGHHAWGVAVIVMHIVSRAALRIELLGEAILHDTGELVTGDIPFTAKRHNAELGQALHQFEDAARVEHMLSGYILTEREKAILKVADTLEGLQWCAKYEPMHYHGMHQGQVHRRWVQAYAIAREKFNELLTDEEWRKADEIFHNNGGVLPVGLREQLRGVHSADS